jgi:hypothetical protein
LVPHDGHGTSVIFTVSASAIFLRAANSSRNWSSR